LLLAYTTARWSYTAPEDIMALDTPEAGAPQADTVPRGPKIQRRPRQGLVLVFTGNGKGKTTAAMGLALRAAGNKMRVRIIQFIKGQWKSGEREALALLAPYGEVSVMGRGFTIERLRDQRIPMEDHAAAARAAWQEAREAVLGNRFDLVILDEILGTVKAGLVSPDELLELVRAKPPELHLALTGRGAPPELVEAADLVTEMRPIKHPLEKGIKAQRGIEF
jgi:cob(I)alamin adenosyltransferase